MIQALERLTPRTVALPLAALALALAGCDVTVTNYLNVDRAEEVISEGITEQTGIVVQSVECPDDVVLEEGHEFECTMTDEEGNQRTVSVTQTDGEGNINWSLE